MTPMRRVLHKTLSILILMCSTAAFSQQTLKYTLVDLGLMGGASAVATGVNNKGQIVGNVLYADGHQDCFLLTLFVSLVKWSGSAFPSRQPNYCTATAINQNGDTAGAMYFKTGLTSYAVHAFRRTASGTIVHLAPLYGGTSLANGLNDSGIVVGESFTNQYSPSAVRWDSAGNGTDLGGLPGSAIANAISSYGSIVGRADGYYLGYLGSFASEWTNGSMVVLPPASFSQYFFYDEAYSIGNGSAFLVAGESLEADGLYHVVEWGSGWRADLGIIDGGSQVVTTDISSDNWISGYGWYTAGFVHSPGCGTYTVSNLLDSSGTGWYLNRIYDMNDSHWLVGSAQFGGSPAHAILLIPNSYPLCYPA